MENLNREHEEKTPSQKLKRVYKTPKLSHFGSVQEQTQAAAVAGGDGGGGSS